MRLLLVIFCLLPLISEASLKAVKSEGWYKKDYTTNIEDNNRKKKGVDSPLWLSSVGKITKKDGSHCSAVLLNTGPQNRFALSLSQCFEGLDSTSIVFLDKDMNEVHRTVKKTTSQGKYWYDEWVVLVLNTPIPTEVISGLTPKPSVKKHELSNYKHVVVGFSDDNDEALGSNGNNLTYDDGCSLEYNKSIPSWYRLESCYAYPGVEGGAHVGLDESGSAFLLGVIAAVKPKISYSIRANLIDLEITEAL